MSDETKDRFYHAMDVGSTTLFLLAAVLFTFIAAPYALADMGIGETAKAVAQTADIARQKDIVWLSLVVAIVAMIISAVKDFFLGKELRALNRNLQGRPCIFTAKFVKEVVEE